MPLPPSNTTPRDYVTVVSGLPRSGTSMMMQILHAGGIHALTDQLRRPDDDNPLGYLEFEPIKQLKKDASWLPQAVGKAVKAVHLLLYDLPPVYQYRVLFMRRKIDEVLASQQKMLQRLGRQGAALKPEQLAAIYSKQLQEVQAWWSKQPNFKVLQVEYNLIVADPTPHLAAINQFLDGNLDAHAMTRVVKPDLYRNRR